MENLLMVSKVPSNSEYQPPTQNVETGTPFMCVNMNERKDTLIYSYAFHTWLRIQKHLFFLRILIICVFDNHALREKG